MKRQNYYYYVNPCNLILVLKLKKKHSRIRRMSKLDTINISIKLAYDICRV